MFPSIKNISNLKPIAIQEPTQEAMTERLRNFVDITEEIYNELHKKMDKIDVDGLTDGQNTFVIGCSSSGGFRLWEYSS